jgi:segregation and condensation protein B
MSENEPTKMPLAAQIQGLLFVASESVTVGQLAETLRVKPGTVELALQELERSLLQGGLRVQRHAGGVQLTSAPELGPTVERFLGLEARTHLSRAALETLALIAYRQPVTHPEIDAVRGVNSESMLKSLLSKGLVYEAGRAEGPGRPILYVTAPEFLQHLGLNSISDLPEIEDAAIDQPHDEMLKG